MARPVIPRFVRRTPSVAQGGVAGHAAVIGAPQTTRVLAILELESALEEQLTTLLGLSKVPGHQELTKQIAGPRRERVGPAGARPTGRREATRARAKSRP